jgi:predicted acyl esterase
MTGGPMDGRSARIPMRGGVELAATLYLPALSAAGAHGTATPDAQPVRAASAPRRCAEISYLE